MFITCFFRLPVWIPRLYHRSNPKYKDSFPREKRYGYIHSIISTVIKRGRVIVHLEGAEKLPKYNPEDENSTGYILFPNHQGLFDTLSLIKNLDEPFSPLSKKELETTFMLKNVLALMDVEYMDRDDVRQSLKVIQTVSKRVKAGDNFVIFPEGTRSREENNLLEFKAGAFKAATMAHAPIIPVALVDSFIPFDIRSIKKTTVYTYILDPLYYDDYKDLKTAEIAEIVKDRIEKKIAEHLAVIPSQADKFKKKSK